MNVSGPFSALFVTNVSSENRALAHMAGGAKDSFVSFTLRYRYVGMGSRLTVSVVIFPPLSDGSFKFEIDETIHFHGVFEGKRFGNGLGKSAHEHGFCIRFR